MNNFQRHVSKGLSSGPPTPTALDAKIKRHHGTTMALEVLPENLQASKKMPTPTPSEWIEQLTRENGNLRCELAYYRSMGKVTDALQLTVNRVRSELERAYNDYLQARKKADEEWGANWQRAAKHRV